MDVLCTAYRFKNSPSLFYAHCAEKGPGCSPGFGITLLSFYAGEKNEFA
ncbi:hypothetical protein V144x_37870 [Gimesia aquarii]|uniref:Uncharacterized protein n=1 Tax=Gimesia aquarii TaxID=2527964 RepID=A0A517VZ70_9PLAN|nr:hypothetical protein V144x_37870 [Gimesia aquarii]